MKLGRFILIRIILITVQIFGISAILFTVYAMTNYNVGISHFGLSGSQQIVTQENERLGTNGTYNEQFFQFWKNRIIGECSDVYEAFTALFNGKDCKQTFGVSWESDTTFGEYARYLPFDDVIFDKAINSLLLFAISFLIYASISTLLGVVAAFYEKRFLDSLLRIVTSLGTAVPAILITDLIIRIGRDPTVTIINDDIPNKVANLNLKLFFEAVSSNMYFTTYESSFNLNGFIDNWYFLLYPIGAMVIISTSFLFRVIRAQFIDEFRKPYVRTAKAKGLSQREIIFKHILPNVLPRIINTFAVTIPISLTNAAIVEYMFKFNGLANMLISSSQNFNFPILLSGGLIFVFFSSLLMLVNDILVGLIQKERSD